ncbi:MAG TPA: hypothetical protein VHL80_08385 [Polyangia bacterium]|nr:hypothetical protein [Polyangia bacterium]
MSTLVLCLVGVPALAAGGYAVVAAVGWFRYGRPRGGGPDTALDAFMPIYDVVERHEVTVAAPAAVALEAAKKLDLEGPRLVRAIFAARARVLRSAPDDAARPRGLLEKTKSMGWGVLSDRAGREIVLGAATKPWEPNPVFRALRPGEFAAFREPGHVKIAWTLGAVDGPDGSSVFRTETRAVATDANARRKFRRYWAFLSPGIRLIRSALLGGLVAEAERAWRLEGDDVLTDARTQLTHAVAIAAPPRDVWPWLVQMGCQRAGWYSWDILDNAGVRSAERIVPELQHLRVGDVLPARPVGKEGFEVIRIVPERALVLRGLAAQWAGTWAFVLEPLGPNGTRLVTRYRAAYAPSARMSLLVPVLKAAHEVMERKQLRTIKHHAELGHAP